MHGRAFAPSALGGIEVGGPQLVFF